MLLANTPIVSINRLHNNVLFKVEQICGCGLRHYKPHHISECCGQK